MASESSNTPVALSAPSLRWICPKYGYFYLVKTVNVDSPRVAIRVSMHRYQAGDREIGAPGAYDMADKSTDTITIFTSHQQKRNNPPARIHCNITTQEHSEMSAAEPLCL